MVGSGIGVNGGFRAVAGSSVSGKTLAVAASVPISTVALPPGQSLADTSAMVDLIPSIMS